MQFDIPTITSKTAIVAADPTPSAHHRNSLEALHDTAEHFAPAEFSVAGDAATDQTTTIGLAIAKVVISHRQRSYRARDILAGPSDSWPTENVRWVPIRGNSSLQTLMSKYGADLLAYDCDQTQVKVEVLSLELFETHSRNVRILVRRPDEN